MICRGWQGLLTVFSTDVNGSGSPLHYSATSLDQLSCEVTMLSEFLLELDYTSPSPYCISSAFLRLGNI